jgi:GNAT superfamily N-acetyltransferase
MCTGFVAQERASGALIGCAFASFMAAEAAMPPPWPTTKPARFYMSNLAVLPEHRRRGAALALLQACELLGELSTTCKRRGHGMTQSPCFDQQTTDLSPLMWPMQSPSLQGCHVSYLGRGAL